MVPLPVLRFTIGGLSESEGATCTSPRCGHLGVELCVTLQAQVRASLTLESMRSTVGAHTGARGYRYKHGTEGSDGRRETHNRFQSIRVLNTRHWRMLTPHRSQSLLSLIILRRFVEASSRLLRGFGFLALASSTAKPRGLPRAIFPSIRVRARTP